MEGSSMQSSLASASRSKKMRQDAKLRAQQIEAQAEGRHSVKDPDTREDVTPKPLMRTSETAKDGKKGSKGGPQISGIESSVSASQSHVSHNSEPTDSMSRATSESDDPNASMSSLSENEESETGGFRIDASESSQGDKAKKSTDSTEKKREKSSSVYATRRKEYTAEDRYAWENAEVTIELNETPTFFIFEKPDESAMKETADAEKNKTLNERYKKFCSNVKGSDRYAERGMTTINRPHKVGSAGSKAPVMKTPPAMQVVSWKMDDELAKHYEDDVDEDVGPTGTEQQAENAAEQTETQEGDDASTVMEDDDGAGESSGGKKEMWLLSTSLLQTLMVVERIVVGNIYEARQLEYRGIYGMVVADDVKRPPSSAAPSEGVLDGTRTGTMNNTMAADAREEAVKAEEAAALKKEEEAAAEKKPTRGGAKSTKVYDAPTLTNLWRYGCDITARKNVTSLSWNHKNPDILAVGYGEFGTHAQSAAKGDPYSGFICCWSLKNPVYPERTIRVESSDAGVSAVHFSHNHPSLLAAGNTDGTLALYDVRKHGNTPALKTSVSTGQHTGTIWEVRWVEKGKRENLVSISADGRVAEWSIKKGLERTAGDLMILKRQQDQSDFTSPYAKGDVQRATEALLSRNSGGMCVDFHKEGLFYVVGTEDGTLFKYTRSQRDTYVTDYERHEEPVYRVRWSPFCQDMFLSCSADWTARLYHHERRNPLLRFIDAQEAVHDVCWSPRVSTVFASATARGRVCVWDLADPLEPVTDLAPYSDGRSFNCLLFANQLAPIIAVGDNQGDVTILKGQGKLFEDVLPHEQGQEKMMEALKPNMK